MEMGKTEDVRWTREQEEEEEEGEGYICPACMMVFPFQAELVRHHEMRHSKAAPSNT